jgi:hypothetical protein
MVFCLCMIRHPHCMRGLFPKTLIGKLFLSFSTENAYYVHRSLLYFASLMPRLQPILSLRPPQSNPNTVFEQRRYYPSRRSLQITKGLDSINSSASFSLTAFLLDRTRSRTLDSTSANVLDPHKLTFKSPGYQDSEQGVYLQLLNNKRQRESLEARHLQGKWHGRMPRRLVALTYFQDVVPLGVL